MPKKFKPQISRIELNPEQAVLVCPCYNIPFRIWDGSTRGQAGSYAAGPDENFETVCKVGTRIHFQANNFRDNQLSS